MRGPSLEFINLDGLIQKLNSNSLESEEEIYLGDFVPKGKNPFIYMGDRKLETRGTYALIQPSLCEILFGPQFGIESGIELGYILVETGIVDRTSNYSGRYESIKLRIKYQFELRNGIIPNSSVKLLRESSEWEEPHLERKDYLYKLVIPWFKTDLSRFLPTEWFLYGRT